MGRMIIYAKVGTGPGQMVHVLRRRKSIEVDDFIHFRDPNQKYDRPKGAICREIRDVGGRNLYVLELM